MGYFTPDKVKSLFPNAQERTYKSGQIVVYDGDMPDHAFYVVRGAYKFYDTDSDGNEKIMYIGGPESFFPIFYSFENKPHVDGFYGTLTTSQFLLIPFNEFQDKLRTHPDLSYEMINWYAHEVEQIIVHLKSMEKTTAKHKLLQVLKNLCEHHTSHDARNGWSRVSFPISQQTLAAFTGLTRETVNSALMELEKQHAVRKPKRLTLELNKSVLDTMLDRG